MLSDADLIRLVAKLYGSPDPAGTGLPPWTTVIGNPLMTVGHIRFQNGSDLFVFPGSETPLDWYQDIDSEPVYMGSRLGLVHAGFMAGPLLVKSKLNALAGAHVALAGHSLGAVHAEDYAALRLSEGLPVDEIVTFGSPRPGCAPMKALLAPVTMRNYRNGWKGDTDPVTTKPFPVPLLFPCMQMRDFTDLAGQLVEAYFSHHVPAPVSTPLQFD